MTNHGFIKPTKKELEDSRKAGFVLGAKGGVAGRILKPDRNWIQYLPPFEPQKRVIETNSCSQFGTISALQMLEQFQFGNTDNYSERALAILSGNNRQGNSPHRVADEVRRSGLAREELLPFNDEVLSWIEYMQPDPLPQEVIDNAKLWLEDKSFSHQWVSGFGTLKKKDLMDALQYSPVGISVRAWLKRDGLYYKPEDAQDNHWVVLTGFKEGEYWEVFDSYLEDGEPIKRLEWDYNFQFAKTFHIEEKSESLSFWDRLFFCLSK